MSSHPYHHVATDDHESLTIFLPDGSPLIANDDHPHFAELIEGAREGIDPAELEALADLSVAVSQKLQPLSERVAVADGRVYFDGDAIDSTLTRQIVRCLDAGLSDWAPLVRFLENAAANPQAHSREQMYDWLRDRDFAITEDGCFIAYKGVAKLGDGSLVSVRSGPAIVDGQQVNGQVPNSPGSTIEIARSVVAFDPSQGCASGLHVGTYAYARGWARGALLKVKVNPRDVVSVPTDCSAEKMRTCRYQVLAAIEAPETEPVGSPVLYNADDDGADF